MSSGAVDAVITRIKQRLFGFLDGHAVLIDVPFIVAVPVELWLVHERDLVRTMMRRRLRTTGACAIVDEKESNRTPSTPAAERRRGRAVRGCR
jgi:hypothetical protein